jgi:membrane peptidoglycan carboxypeptidase
VSGEPGSWREALPEAWGGAWRRLAASLERGPGRYPGWRELRPSFWVGTGAWLRRNWAWPAGVIGAAVLAIGLWIGASPPDLTVVATLMDAPAYTYFSADTRPGGGSDERHACAVKQPGQAPPPDAVIGQSGASRPDAFDMIACAREDLDLTRANGAPGRPWGTARNLIDALVAQEDRDFWESDAAGVRGMLALMRATISQRGGSNLSMQTIKQLYFRGAHHRLSPETVHRMLYERQYQWRLKTYLEDRLAKGLTDPQRRLHASDVKAAMLSLYLQVASAERLTVSDDERQRALEAGLDPPVECRFEEQLLKEAISEPECVNQLGVAIDARRFYGKRLDQLTIAEAASVVASLESVKYNPMEARNQDPRDCDKLVEAARQERAQLAPQLKQLAARRDQLRKRADGSGEAARLDREISVLARRFPPAYYNNRCKAAYVIKVMANDPRVLKRRTLLDRLRGRLWIPKDQLPASMKGEKVPFITEAQEQAALAELDRLAVCGRVPQRSERDIETRLKWCSVNGMEGGVAAPAADFVHWLGATMPPAGPGPRANVAVYTTLDPAAQRAAIAALDRAPSREDPALMPSYKGPGPIARALVTLNGQGEVKAYVGLAGLRRGALPGSTLKPLIFATRLQHAYDQAERLMPGSGPAAAAAAFEERVWWNDCARHPARVRPDALWWEARGARSCSQQPPGEHWAWLPRNSEAAETGSFGGCAGGGAMDAPGSLHEALCRSLNTVTAEVAISLGRQNIAEMMSRLGIDFYDGRGRRVSFPLQDWNQSVIGEGAGTVRPLNLAAGYAVFVNGGKRVKPHAIRQMFVQPQVRGQPAVPLAVDPPPPSQALSPAVVELVRSGLRDVVHAPAGTAYGAGLKELPGEIAGKTGTVQADGVTKDRDIWFVGYREAAPGKPEVTAVWLSYGRGYEWNGKRYAKRPVPPNIAQVQNLYGKHAALVYGAYLQGLDGNAPLPPASGASR